ncbi:unnamed protein product [Closterium sp. Yama58-4]|nr:unnamed protein product [Closterium sp. Yama58-4]
MIRVWERMKRIIPSNPSSAAAASASDATAAASGDSSSNFFPEACHRSHLSQSLLAGLIPADQRGPSWIAMACSDPEDDLINRTSYTLLKERAASAPPTAEVYRDTLCVVLEWREKQAQALLLKQEQQQQQQQQEKWHGDTLHLSLLNLIKAYSVCDPDTWYCSGMGWMALTLLSLMVEEDAFLSLLFLMHRCGLRGLFAPNMHQLNTRLSQLSQFLAETTPRLHSFFEDLQLKPSMYAADWLLSLFARHMPQYLVYRVFDIVLAEKTMSVVFKLAIVLLQVTRRQLMLCPEFDYCLHFLHSELPLELNLLPDRDVEELVSKALRVRLPFESVLRLEAEYDQLAGEAAVAAQEVQAAAEASEVAAESWERDRQELEGELLHALELLGSSQTYLSALFSHFKAVQAHPKSFSLPDLPPLPEPPTPPEPAQPRPLVVRIPGLEPGADISTMSTAALLSAVATLRKQRAAAEAALMAAEQQLMECIRSDNAAIDACLRGQAMRARKRQLTGRKGSGSGVGC